MGKNNRRKNRFLNQVVLNIEIFFPCVSKNEKIIRKMGKDQIPDFDVSCCCKFEC